MDDCMTPIPDLAPYDCHKRVEAAKIARVEWRGMREWLVFESGAMKEMPTGWVKQHSAKAGGYYVVYEDGYTSFSPAEAFENGYTKVDNGGEGA